MEISRVTGLVLAGGRGTRFGGVDKGLQPFLGQPLARRALDRLAPQVGTVAVSANRHIDEYAHWGVPVWSDSMVDYPGPLAGMLSGLEQCQTDWLLTVPCDSPLFPLDLAERLSAHAAADNSLVAFAAAPEIDVSGQRTLRPQPVFCLLHRDLRDNLAQYLASGSHRVMHWLMAQPHSQVAFDLPCDDPKAFSNTNTPEDLQRLELALNTKPTK
ncbi:molybdenum cofactor guanylyltransferase [Diaphorobacter sp. HDW4A]|nr:molybdenum cofactor guanylyltransferase MobA [Diaphorobacter sp. HDW4A]QIL83756.1 molybdenum cofactor guanylyltransferase [Diaphorobacter sp. HDW4A]